MTRPQLPGPGEIFLDHVAWFVPDMSAAAAALDGLGFTLTPFTRQMNATPEGPIPAGMANRCAMLEAGYLEFLTAVGDTPLARQFAMQVERYVGLHLLAFTEPDAEAAHLRLDRAGFHPQPPVNLRRRVELADGQPAEAAFTVLRLQPATMPEGRIQLLAHHTEGVVWQERWLGHANRVVGLEAALLAVADADEAAGRFARFTGREAAHLSDGRRCIRLERGALVFASRPWVEAHVLPLPAPAPVIAAVAIGTDDPAATTAALEGGGAVARSGAYALPAPLGGGVTPTLPGALPAWAR